PCSSRTVCPVRGGLVGPCPVPSCGHDDAPPPGASGGARKTSRRTGRASAALGNYEKARLHAATVVPAPPATQDVHHADWRKSRKGSRPDSRLTAWSPALDTTVSEIAMSAAPSVPGSSPLATPAETVPLAGQHIVVVGGGMTAHRFAS